MRTLDKSNYIEPFQLEFRLGFSIETALIMLPDGLWRSWVVYISLVLFDLSAAFDTVDAWYLSVLTLEIWGRGHHSAMILFLHSGLFSIRFFEGER